MSAFQKAVKTQAKGRLGIIGPSGSGKTYTALAIAQHMGGKVAMIDTEHGSASLYADQFLFDTLLLDNFDPRNYIDAIHAAGAAGYDVLIIDSLSHAWAGPGGALEMADRNMAKYSGNKWAAWRDVSPLHNQLIEAMLSYPGHLIATMRSKMDYIQTQDDKGKTVIRKVGMAPIQRDGMEYEFGIVGEMDLDHNFNVTKTRCSPFDGLFLNKPGKEFADKFIGWLNDGAIPEVAKAVPKSVEQGKPAEPNGPLAEQSITPDDDKDDANPNFAKLWAAVRNMGKPALTREVVHQIAGKSAGVEGLTSLKQLPQFTTRELNKLILDCATYKAA
jgi:DNA polymerase III delta prime subunit